ncbi:hypothetical protein MKX03_017805, partial [Papaver bracteatum]
VESQVHEYGKQNTSSSVEMSGVLSPYLVDWIMDFLDKNFKLVIYWVSITEKNNRPFVM